MSKINTVPATYSHVDLAFTDDIVVLDLLDDTL